MKLSYDRDRNVAYLRLRPKSIGVETIRVSDELNVDIAPDGSVYGIELLNANEQLRASDGGQLVLVDELTTAVRLPCRLLMLLARADEAMSACGISKLFALHVAATSE
jgi:uncharacterized protein YuzE